MVYCCPFLSNLSYFLHTRSISGSIKSNIIRSRAFDLHFFKSFTPFEAKRKLSILLLPKYASNTSRNYFFIIKQYELVKKSPRNMSFIIFFLNKIIPITSTQYTIQNYVKLIKYSFIPRNEVRYNREAMHLNSTLYVVHLI